MNPANVPVWGCPWHGLVKNGQLVLPNSASISYPQPAGDQWQSGSTALVQHPGAPTIIRTPDEQAADDAAGRQWWNNAILANSTLYGVSLNGWIYIDPAGDSWLVQTTLPSVSVTGGTANVTLKRFGVLGGAPIEHTYPVAVPDMGQSTPAVGGTGSLRISRYHTRADGSAAVFEIAAEFDSGAKLFWRMRPVGWLEVTLAGPGSECEIAVTVLKTRVQTLGTAAAQQPATTPDNYYLRENEDGSSDIVQTQPVGGNWSTLVAHSIIDGQETSGFIGYVVGMHYDAAGTRHEVTINEQAVTNYTSLALVHSGATSFDVGVPVTGSWTCTTDWDSTLTLTYLLDDVALCSYAVGVVEQSTEVYTRNGASPSTLSVEAHADFTPGSYLNVSSLTEPENDPLGQQLGGAFAEALYAAAEAADVPAGLGGAGLVYGWYYAPNYLRYLQSCPYRYSNLLFGHALWQPPQQVEDTLVRTVYQPDVATPLGFETLTELVLEKHTDPFTFTDFAYGSWCPVTEQLARDTAPICWV